jgi:type I restriction enzyme S subunit
MLEIMVPVPPIEQQRSFDDLLLNVHTAQQIRKDAAKTRSAMLPSILDRAFKGAL